ncbi:LacI family DNA-binding transcriptional regulator [Rhodoligotrophos defluvii]|uniref:LacI family DNA-binding transcriptional regulator n=1 Tax=Rhodoligotrophos defluvii TaxID=2561934 RepID=UPI0010C96E01|nr:LacI family DNA-binding transcriptional regulator [Rhodoligotrophos defluvii]
MKDRKRVTIRDVANECGIALSTVSNALAGKQHVSEETRALVREAAERLGYRASAVARALRMQRSFTIGVLIADITNPAFPGFVRGVEDVAIREKCNLLLCNTDGEEEKQLWHMRALLDSQVDGMVLISQHVDTPRVRELLDSGTPFVLVQRRSARHQDDYVGSDNVSGITQAVEHLAGLGHKRIGFVRGPMDSSTAAERLESYKAAVRRLKLDRAPELIFNGDYNLPTGYDAGLHFLSLPERPTAIMASNDLNAMGVIEAAAELGIEVPSELSVVGLDDIQLASFRRIDLTTIHLQKRAMGAAAAEMLMKRIRNPRPSPAREQIFPTGLVVRGSTARAPQVSSSRKRKKEAV